MHPGGGCSFGGFQTLKLVRNTNLAGCCGWFGSQTSGPCVFFSSSSSSCIYSTGSLQLSGLISEVKVHLLVTLTNI